MADSDPGKWRRLPKMSFSSKDLTRRMKKVEGATVKHARRFVFKRWNNFREVRSRIALWVLTIGIIIGASGLQFFWYQNDYRTKANAAGGTYAEAVLGPVETLNPIFAKSSAEEAAGELLFSRLVDYDSTGHLNYDLADSMKVSEDGKTYTFTIRPDAQWSDGIFVRARDVVYTVNTVKDASTRSTLTGWAGITVKAVDELTVAFQLPAVYAAFPHALRFLPILPEHTLRDTPNAKLRESSFSTNPVGSGAYVLRLLQDIDTATGRKVIHLAKNKEYYGGQAKLDRIQLHVYKDAESIKRALATSEVNAASDLSVLNASAVSSERYKVDYSPVNAGVYALFNTTRPIMSDKKVRQALQVGTDTSKVRSAISDKLPELYLPFLTSQLSGAIPTAPKYDTKLAAQLLDEAGWKLEGNVRKKGGQDLNLSVVTTKNTDFEKALSGLTEQWRALGITTTTRIVDPTDPAQNVVGEILQPREFDVLIYQLTIGADPDVYAYWHGSQAGAGFNFSNYKSIIGDDALLSARTRIEPELRNAKYITFAKEWLSDAPAIGIYQATSQYIHTQNVHTDLDTRRLISSADRYSGVMIWSVGSRNVFMTP